MTWTEASDWPKRHFQLTVSYCPSPIDVITFDYGIDPLSCTLGESCERRAVRIRVLVAYDETVREPELYSEDAL
jgi:hypothetical protein